MPDKVMPDHGMATLSEAGRICVTLEAHKLPGRKDELGSHEIARQALAGGSNRGIGKTMAIANVPQ